MNRTGLILATLAFLFGVPASMAATETAHPWLDKQLAKQRVKCPAGTSPFRGPDDAPVKIVEFVDYECPYCADQEKTMKQVLEAYPTQVKLIIKNLPLPIHPKAKHKALVAECMNAQGKFWQAHDRFLAGKPFKQATDGADEGKLQSCIAQGGDGQVDKDLALAKNLGMATTPGFVIDGIRQGGTIGFKQFQLLIDAELERKKQKSKEGEG